MKSSISKLPRRPAKNFKEMRERLISYVLIDPATGCWNWKNKPIKPNGRKYPYVNFRGKYQKASRIAFVVFKGIELNGLCALHTCDNSWCINPEHLYAGTFSDNIKDCHTRKRHPRSREDHCPLGHKRFIVTECGQIRRRCLECKRAAARKWCRKHGKE